MTFGGGTHERRMRERGVPPPMLAPRPSGKLLITGGEAAKMSCDGHGG